MEIQRLGEVLDRVSKIGMLLKIVNSKDAAVEKKAESLLQCEKCVSDAIDVIQKWLGEL